MEFQLNEYHRNISDEELINDVINTARRLGKTSLTVKEYSQNGTFNISTLTRRFKGWKNVLTLCHLDLENHSFRVNISNDAIINDVIRVKNIYKKDTITKKEYDAYGIFRSATLFKHGMSWNQILQMCGLKLNVKRDFSKEDLLKEIERLWVKLGRQPTVTDINNGESLYSLNTFIRHFGGWRNALLSFIDYVNGKDEHDPSSNETSIIQSHQEPSSINHDEVSEVTQKHKTPREPNLRLRFRVLQRDQFKCCSCGASPAKDPAVELHVDHIFPWSKGGETVLENLQTLCSKCNGGKSNLT